MDRIKMNKLIVISIISVLTLALNPIGSYAEWKHDSTGWWYSEQNSYATGWKNIDNKWYFFNENGYMAHDTIVDGYYLESNGEAAKTGDYVFDKVTGKILKYNKKDSIEVNIPNEIDGVKVKTIGDKAFYGCTQLNSVYIPEEITNIENNAFASCYSLKKVNIPDSLISIGTNAFNGCTSLVNIDIKDGVNNISKGAFSGCYNLTFHVYSQRIKESLVDSGISKTSIIIG